ncbi:hypothetical protein Hdeb2414_s0025g00666931 [Helianthus debilis subsp. tardiflorus]
MQGAGSCSRPNRKRGPDTRPRGGPVIREPEPVQEIQPERVQQVVEQLLGLKFRRVLDDAE